MAIVLVLVACGGADSDDGVAQQTPTSEADAISWPTEGWEVSSPEAEGMSSVELAGLDGYCDEFGCQAVVVARHGRIVWETYAAGWDQDSTDIGFSTAKSVTSALVGIAIEEGLIEGVDQRASDFVKEWQGTDKEEITLRHLLSLTSGLEWDEGYTGQNDVTSMFTSSDHVSYVLERPLAVQPGERFQYSTGDPEVFSRILLEATGVEAREYAADKIFSVIGMLLAFWPVDALGQTMTYCCITTTAREFAKFGYLYLRDGQWDGRQIVPAQWVRESTQPSQEMFMQYGFYWWLPQFPDAPEDTFEARGIQAKHIYVIPSLDIVAVRLGTVDRAGDGNAFLRPIVQAVTDN